MSPSLKIKLPPFPPDELFCCIVKGKPIPLINQSEAKSGMKLILNCKSYRNLSLSNNWWFYFPQMLIPCSSTIVGWMINSKKGI